MDPSDVVIRFRDVHKSFGPHHILRGVTMDVHKGKTLGIMGGSGTGKSVALRHIIGLMQADSGLVEVRGHDMSSISAKDLRKLRSNMGYVFQEGALINWMSIEDNVALPLRENHPEISDDEVRSRVAEKLDLVGVGQAGKKLPSEISGGMKKRVGIARALITEPELLLYDEPNAGLDPAMSRTVNEHIRMVADLGKTSVVVEHRIGCMKKVADEVIYLLGGKVHLRLPTDEFFESKDPDLVEFLGTDKD
ncbi:MAG: phospholipid/cholesterol/gamma-HCH transport system ATP-binding protein [Planctomycetota bacterium]|jgi:phospholipid/cholesterol/gamma-HCH transport system ATP-binding protein